MSEQMELSGTMQGDSISFKLPKGFGCDEARVRAIVSEQLANGEFPAERVAEMIAAAIDAVQVQKIVLETREAKRLGEIGRQHYKFELLVKCYIARINCILVGPAGSGKSTAVHELAKSVAAQYGATSYCNQTSKADLFGFIDAAGKYHEPMLVKLAREGGVYLGDEIDGGNANVNVMLNMLLANGHFSTPVGMVEKHKDFFFAGGANTYGSGANRVYVGRNQLDAATLDRFAFIDWDYDPGLEASIIGCKGRSPKFDIAEGGTMEPQEWYDFVKSARKASDKLGLRVVVSPRATIHGAALFSVGVGRKHVESMVLWKGTDEATVAKIKEEMVK